MKTWFWFQNLAIVDIQPKPNDLLDEFKAEHPQIRIVYFECDISVKDEIESTFDSIGSIFQSVDILINAAGIFNDKNVEQTFKVNVVRAIKLTWSFLFSFLVRLSLVINWTLFPVWNDLFNNDWNWIDAQRQAKLFEWRNHHKYRIFSWFGSLSFAANLHSFKTRHRWIFQSIQCKMTLYIDLMSIDIMISCCF